MAERLQNTTPENRADNHKESRNEQHRARQEREVTSQEKEHGQQKQVEELHKTAVEKAATKEQHQERIESNIPTKKHHPMLVNKQLKDMAYMRALTRTRKKLSAPARAFSKAIHSDILDKPSEAIGKTIARPSGMLGGAFFAMIGTSLLLWVTRHYGYEYNYLAAILLFAVGMVAGLLLEASIRSIRRGRK